MVVRGKRGLWGAGGSGWLYKGSGGGEGPSVLPVWTSIPGVTLCCSQGVTREVWGGLSRPLSTARESTLSQGSV